MLTEFFGSVGVSHFLLCVFIFSVSCLEIDEALIVKVSETKPVLDVNEVFWGIVPVVPIDFAAAHKCIFSSIIFDDKSPFVFTKLTGDSRLVLVYNVDVWIDCFCWSAAWEA